MEHIGGRTMRKEVDYVLSQIQLEQSQMPRITLRRTRLSYASLTLWELHKAGYIWYCFVWPLNKKKVNLCEWVVTLIDLAVNTTALRHGSEPTVGSAEWTVLPRKSRQGGKKREKAGVRERQMAVKVVSSFQHWLGQTAHHWIIPIWLWPLASKKWN